MAWRIVVQPDGKYARFSEVVDGFTHINMTRDECYEMLRESLAPRDAEGKILRAEQNLHRFKEEVETIKNIHGEEELQRQLSQFEFLYEPWVTNI